MSPDPSAIEQQIEQMIEAEVARATAPYRALGLPADVLAEMEAMLRIGLCHHPDARALLRALATDPTVYRSDQIAVSGIEEALRRLREDGK